MTIAEIRFQLIQKLKIIYSESEAVNITELVLEHVFKLSKSELIINSQRKIDDNEDRNIVTILARLLQHEPIQYILQEAWFYNYKFFIDKNVLIPRPETEELVEWILKESVHQKIETILDVGTGSGCISIALKIKLPTATVTAIDCCSEALFVAATNAANLNAEVNLMLLDFLNKENRKQLEQFDIIVSNPPYIPRKDKETMNKNVWMYEPEIALFVPDYDPVIFYTSLAEFGKEHLKEGGSVFTEIHEDFADGVSAIFKKNEFPFVTVKKDLQGKARMIQAK